MSSFDLVVIGSGPGGYVAAARAAQVGLSTAVVEKDAVVGGTCLWRGCIPTKALLENAAVYEQTRDAKQFGITTGEVKLDFSVVMQRKTVVVRKLGKGVEGLLKRNKVTTYQGYGRLSGRGKVSVTSADGAAATLQAKNVLLATGSAPKMLPGLKADGKRVVTSDEIVELKALPASMIVLGAGAVGVEFASIFNRFGTKVTLVEMLPRVLPIEDEEISAELAKILVKQGIAVHTGVMAKDFTVAPEKVSLSISPAQGSGGATVLSAEMLLVATGRGPLTNDLGLAGTGVKLERGFVTVDGYMRTGEPGVYAIGDIVNSPQLAHVASAEGILAVEHMAGREVRPINYDHVPSATYCEPEVASVGLTEAKAKERGHQVKTGKFPFSHNSKAPILGHTEGFVKIVADAKYGELLGMHMLGPRVTELLPAGGVALTSEATIEELHRTIFAHPTLSEAIPEAARAVFDHAIHS